MLPGGPQQHRSYGGHHGNPIARDRSSQMQHSQNGQAATPPQSQPYAGATAEELEEINRVKVTPALLDYIQTTRFPYINDVRNYEIECKIGQGTFGEVFKAKCKRTGRLVALKKILMENEKEGFPITALREVRVLQQLKHENITELIEVCSNKATSVVRDRSTFFLVFVFYEHDLAGLLSNTKIRFQTPHIKALLKHLFNGLSKLHRSKILHRDMKAANVLISREGVLKLADFGLARTFFNSAGQQRLYTNRVVTLWYRPPELLLGSRSYTTAIDCWGAGCIMAELWTRNPIMQGDTEQRQLTLITQLCGSITPEVWPKVEELPLYNTLELNKDYPRQVTRKMMSVIKDEEAVKLLDKLLTLDPEQRISADDALMHQYFFSHPHPKENIRDLIATLNTSHFEFTSGRGPHRNRQQVPPQRPPQNRAIPPGQFQDMIF